MSPAVSQFSPDGLPAMASGEMLGSYRQSPGSAYPYAGKPYYGPVPGWSNGYADDSGDYGLQYAHTHAQPHHSYPCLTLEDEARLTLKCGANNRLSPGGKYSNGAAAAAAAAANGGIYIDVDPGYPYTTNSPNLVHRPQQVPLSAADLSNFSLTSVAASMPQSHPQQLHGVSSKERMLPSPTRNLAGSNGLASYRSDSSTSLYQLAKVGSSVAPSAHTSPVTTIPDVTSGYSAYDGSPIATAYAHSVQQAATTQQPSPMASFKASSASESIFSAAENALRTQSPSTELAYRYSGSPHRGDSGSSGPQLANGQVYTAIPPPPAGSVGGAGTSYLMSGASGGGPGSGDMGGGSVKAEAHRRAVAGLHAA